MKNNKYPGQDGLTLEFYKTFWHDIKKLFYSSLMKSIEDSILLYSQRNWVISLIYEKRGNRKFKSQTHNVDYKIFAHIFARRLQKVADGIINPEQSAYLHVEGRYKERTLE